MQNSQQDVIIIGGGVSGTALLYMLSKYTDLKKITLLEKYSSLASVNSHGRNNSQTLHCGDIETNYSLDKAVQVKASAAMVERYASRHPNRDKMLYRYSKMVLGVGAHECEGLAERYETFRPYFPSLQLFDGKAISEIEPNVTRGRQEQILALGIKDEYSAVNFQLLSQSFADDAQQVADKSISVRLNTRVKQIDNNGDGFDVVTDQGRLSARFVVVSAGGHSLLFAQRMGYGLEYACLPIAGSFYYTPSMLNGKVYTVQNDKLPFAAIHGDPDILVPGKTRFGPTALMLPMLERYNYSSIPEFMKVFSLDGPVLAVMKDLFMVKDIRDYLFKNMLFEVPLVRRRLFLKDAQKVVPMLQLDELTFAHHVGGIRPVMIDKSNRKLHMGEAKINPGNGIIFNMTPSPGATSCLYNAEKDMRILAQHLDCHIDDAGLERDLKKSTAV